MKPAGHRVLLASGIALLALSTAAGAQPRAELTVQARVAWDGGDGYTPVYLKLLSKRPTEVAVTVVCEGYESVGGEAKASMAIPLEAHKEVERTLLLPPMPYDIGRCHAVEWTTREGTTGKTMATAENQVRDAAMLVVDPAERFDESDAEWRLSDKVAYRANVPTTRVVTVDPVVMPRRWQGYPEHIAVLLTSEGDAKLDEAQRGALTAWSRSGGGLLVETEAQESAWAARGARVRQVDIKDRDKLTDHLLERVTLLAPYKVALAPVPGTEEVPVDGFMVLVLLYALIAGPLNLWWVIRRRRRQLFLLTTPLLSLATLVVLLGYNLVAEGVDTRRIASELHLLPDEGSTEAFSWSAITYFSPFPPSELSADPEQRVVPINPEDSLSWAEYSHYMDNPNLFRERRFELRWTPDALRMSGNWIPSRRNRQLLYSGPRSERARLMVARQEGRWVLTNGLGATIDWLTWRTPEGDVLSVQNLAAGASAALDGTVLNRSQVQLPSQLGPSAWLTWTSALTTRGWFRAEVTAPLAELPGPQGTDEGPPRVFVTGRLGPLPPKEGT